MCTQKAFREVVSIRWCKITFPQLKRFRISFRSEKWSSYCQRFSVSDVSPKVAIFAATAFNYSGIDFSSKIQTLVERYLRSFEQTEPHSENSWNIGTWVKTNKTNKTIKEWPKYIGFVVSDTRTRCVRVFLGKYLHGIFEFPLRFRNGFFFVRLANTQL